MEIEQIIKKVDWLDEERRKDKLQVGSLVEQLKAVESNIPPLAHQLQNHESEITRLKTQQGRMDAFDQAVMAVRIEAKEKFEEMERQFLRRLEEADKIRRTEQRAIESSIAEAHAQDSGR
jgi:chromosome segregation ATPase